ncbi:unnamed protein product [Spirodela intermedia]|uniref:GTD-binding domain-containing protein n=1 Tax=Spirodela intermedia TaxID=51605 RepID=A0A7I8JCZ5_SPIIN|nr:unnamed protein product [Spirodela intermedia]CAA6667969.1 unnamed protein product [Spirodela intermedia]
MASREIRNWTFCGLVGAFLDLALVYFMLCGATFAFFAAKFLGVFGLHLPCPCGGLFGHPDGQCLHGLLVEHPPRKISSVMTSVRNSFPFDAVWTKGEGSPRDFDEKFTKDGGAQSDTLVEKTREEAESSWSQNSSSCDLSSVNRASQAETNSSPRRLPDNPDGRGKSDVNNLKPPLGPRRRRRSSTEQRKSSPVFSSSSRLSLCETQDYYHNVSEQMTEVDGEDVATLQCGDDHPISDNQKSFSGLGSSQHLASSQATERDLVTSPLEDHSFDGDKVEAIRVLEKALEQERTSRSHIYLELEKERSAAATAADEAMSMILRLQKEKAGIEMEARQYQRMIEEKNAYDEEETNILKEIIIRERGKIMQIILSGEGSEQQMLDELQLSTSSLEGKDASLGDMGNEQPSWGSAEEGKYLKASSDERLQTSDGHCVESPEGYDEKGMLTATAYPSQESGQTGGYGDDLSLSRSSGSLKNIFHDEEPSVDKIGDNCSKTVQQFTCDGGSDWEDHQDHSLGGSKSCDPHLRAEQSVYDVHFINDKICEERDKKQNDFPFAGSVSSLRTDDLGSEHPKSRNIEVIKVQSADNLSEAEKNAHRSSPNPKRVLRPVDSSSDCSSHCGLRRSSMSAVDKERLILETEVEFLRERLKLVQRGREMLHFSVGSNDKENLQLQLLEEIASQLCEIRRLTEPRKATWQVPLPPLSKSETERTRPQFSSKKRRCQSVPLGFLAKT